MRSTTARPGARPPVILVPVLALALLVGVAGCGEGGTEVGTAATAPSTTATLPPIEGDARQQLEAARARWAASGIDSYELAWSWVCFCPPVSGWSRVVDGEVVDGWTQTEGSPGAGQVVDGGVGDEAGQDTAAPTTATIPGTPPGSIPGTTLPDHMTSTVPPDPATSKPGDPRATPPGVPETTIPSGTETTVPNDEGPTVSISDPDAPPSRTFPQLTVDVIFDEIEAALDEGADEVVVDYDPDTGRPRQVDIDWITNAIDDETGIVVDSFRIIEGDGPAPVAAQPSVTGTSVPPEVEAVATADLSVDHGCGHGFFVGNPEQTVALRLSWQPDLEPNAGMPAAPEPDPVTLPDRHWESSVLLGTDLYANWCDDVLEPDEPRSEVVERWDVTAGTITFTDPPDSSNGCGTGPTVRATVEGLEATGPDGTTVGLPDLEVVNDAWGCIPG